ncbi:leucyl/phenylalanyl-tRNA--protein transferase [Nocardioides gilvus]|uniref:leucyl/phenylalanyl-tRNA--protein transferase n=1 Tax=Nocardioides gilvus TaxID=1735589 RepID=UPI000D749AE3|nr:leucyl/phenylalanyl-tRNA--protein transferase [Nocardioides gilvus]
MPIEPPPSLWGLAEVARDLSRLDPTDDLVAIGADLEPGTLLAAYRCGLFPMPSGEEGDQPMWFLPVRRGVLPLDELKVSRSLRRSARTMEIRVDTAFDEVIAACGDPSRPHAWIDSDIVTAYTALHRMGWAHSVEAWRDGELVGGLYGIAVGGLFAGESMFHRATDASKVALWGLVEMMRDEYADRRVLDVQWSTDHLASLGVVEVSRGDYAEMLADAAELPLPAAFDDTVAGERRTG